MKKFFKILGILLLIILIIAGLGWWYVNKNFIDFEKNYSENKGLKELTIGNKKFIDRNGNGKLDIYEDDTQSVDDRIEDVLQQMTLEEKIHLLKGSGIASLVGMSTADIPGVAGTIVPTPRLGLPTVYLSDGPAGLRIEPKRKGSSKDFFCTAFPIGTALSSTWNTELVSQVGAAMGSEARDYGIDVILGPGVNIHRHPLCGRNFEYYSEDPVLTGYIGSAMVNGIESKGVGSSVKHFAANNQETYRMENDVLISPRALHEIYLKGYEIIVKNSQPWTIMSSYNKINGTYTSESKALLTDILRNDWKFNGLVVSDWFGGDNAVAQINAGNDLLEPGTNLQWKALTKGYETGSLKMEEINTSVRRILRLIFESHKMKNNVYSNNPDLKANALITRQSAAEGIVLLKNNATLPLSTKTSVALLGSSSYDFISGGTGSGDVNEAYTISLKEGLSNAGISLNKTSDKVFSDFKYSHKKEFIKPQGLEAMTKPYKTPFLVYSDDQLISISKETDIGIITIGRNSGEGGDRVEKDDFLLTNQEKDLIKRATDIFHKAGKKIVVVLNIGGVIETASWNSAPDAIILAWQGGQESGNSLADVLTGAISPSGRLPMTFPKNLSDHASNANFPLDSEPYNMFDLFKPKKTKAEKDKIKNKDFTKYEEDIYVGYRHFDKKNIEVAYPFGYGLSYSSFEYSNLMTNNQRDTLMVSVDVKNTGTYAAKEVVQVYCSKPVSQVERPNKELKAFAKTKSLQPSEETKITLKIPLQELRYWSEKSAKWELENGEYLIHVGSSSRDLKLKTTTTISK